MKNLTLTNLKDLGMNWTKGTAGDFTFQIKHFDEGSEYGIDNGRISKLEIRDKENRIHANFDRGWDVQPTRDFPELLEAYAAIIAEFN